jgi:hypothetical protein
VASILLCLALGAGCADQDEFRIAREEGLLLEYRLEGDCGWEALPIRLGEDVDQVDIEPDRTPPRLVWRERRGAVHGGALSLAPEAASLFLTTPHTPITMHLLPAPGVPLAGAVVLLRDGHALPEITRDPRVLHRRWAGKTEPVSGEPALLDVEVWWSPAARALSATLRVDGKDRLTGVAKRRVEGNWEGTRLKGFEVEADGLRLVTRVPDSPEAALTGQFNDRTAPPAQVIIAPVLR